MNALAFESIRCAKLTLDYHRSAEEHENSSANHARSRSRRRSPSLLEAFDADSILAVKMRDTRNDSRNHVYDAWIILRKDDENGTVDTVKLNSNYTQGKGYKVYHKLMDWAKKEMDTCLFALKKGNGEYSIRSESTGAHSFVRMKDSG